METVGQKHIKMEVEYDYYLKLAELYDTIDLNVHWDWKEQHQEMPSSNAQRLGAIAETQFSVECLKRDFEPHYPTTPMPWDLIVTCPAGTLKVQVKSTSQKHTSTGSCYTVVTSVGSSHKEIMSPDIDVLACYIRPESTWFLIPRKLVPGKTIKLNPDPASKSRYKQYQDNWNIFYE